MGMKDDDDDADRLKASSVRSFPRSWLDLVVRTRGGASANEKRSEKTEKSLVNPFSSRVKPNPGGDPAFIVNADVEVGFVCLRSPASVAVEHLFLSAPLSSRHLFLSSPFFSRHLLLFSTAFFGTSRFESDSKWALDGTG